MWIVEPEYSLNVITIFLELKKVKKVKDTSKQKMLLNWTALI